MRSWRRGGIAALFAALLLLVPLAGPASAAADEAAPADVQRRMKPAGISLLYRALPTKTAGGAQTYAHLYVVPPKGAAPVGAKPGTPITREDIGPGATIPRSAFYLEILARRGGRLTALNTVAFSESGGCNEFATRWLEPAKRRGLVLLLRFGVGDAGAWQVVAFPRGLSAPASVQAFAFWGDAEGSSLVRFDRGDARGFLTVTEEWSQDEGKKRGVIRYAWDGTRFTDPQARWFVIAASAKTRSEADAFVRKHADLLSGAEVLESRRFPKLAPGVWVVVPFRTRTAAEAKQLAGAWKGTGVEPYAKQAL